MRTPRKRLTISIDAEVHDSLVRIVGRRKIGRLLEELARPHVAMLSLDDAYAEVAREGAREAEALAWSEDLIVDARRNPHVPPQSHALTADHSES